MQAAGEQSLAGPGHGLHADLGLGRRVEDVEEDGGVSGPPDLYRGVRPGDGQQVVKGTEMINELSFFGGFGAIYGK